MLTFLIASYYVFMFATMGLGVYFIIKKKGVFKIYGVSVTTISFIQFPFLFYLSMTNMTGSNEFVFYIQEIVNFNSMALMLLCCHLYMFLAWIMLIIKRK